MSSHDKQDNCPDFYVLRSTDKIERITETLAINDSKPKTLSLKQSDLMRCLLVVIAVGLITPAYEWIGS